MRTHDVGEAIKSLGFPVLDISEPDDQCDGSITISREVTVQVCSFSRDLIVNRFDGEVFHHSPSVVNVADLADAIKQAMSEAEKHPLPEAD